MSSFYPKSLLSVDAAILLPASVTLKYGSTTISSTAVVMPSSTVTEWS